MWELDYLDWLEVMAHTIRHLRMRGEEEALDFLCRVIARDAAPSEMDESAQPDPQTRQVALEFLEMARGYDQRLRAKEARTVLVLARLGRQMKKERRFHDGKRVRRIYSGLF